MQKFIVSKIWHLTMHCPKIIKGYVLWIKVCVLYMCVCLTHTHTHCVFRKYSLCESLSPTSPRYQLCNLQSTLSEILDKYCEQNQNGIFLFSLEQQLDQSLFNCSLQQTTKKCKTQERERRRHPRSELLYLYCPVPI